MSIGSISGIAGFGYMPKFRAAAADVSVQRPDAANVRRLDTRRDDVRAVDVRRNDVRDVETRRDDIRSAAVAPDSGVARGKVVDLTA